MNPDRIRIIFDKLLRASTAHDTVISMHGAKTASTRYANNAITQNMAKNQIMVSVKTAFGNQVGSSWTNELDEEALVRMVRRAEAAAKIAPPDPEYMPPVDPQDYPQVDAYVEATAGFGPEQRAEAIKKVSHLAKHHNLTTAGILTNAETLMAATNSCGLYAYNKSTRAHFTSTVMTANSSGWAATTNEDIQQIDTAQLFTKALLKAKLSADPREIAPGKYTVILEPAAVSEMLAFMFGMSWQARPTDEGRTFLSGKLKKQLFHPEVTLRSQPGYPQIPGNPFLQEGLAAPTIVWAENGMVKNLICGRYWAKKKGVSPTGWPSNLIMNTGPATLKDMVESTERGILITRFWYIRPVEPMTLLLTGMTRDGAFWIEKGKIQYGIKNLRFNDSPARMLNNIETIGTQERTGEFFDMLVPAIKVRDFNFTSKTKF